MMCPSCTTPVITETGENTSIWRAVNATVGGDYETLGAGKLLDDRYRIVSLLGRGGMGEVYRAQDLKLEQDVALKLLPPKKANDPKWLRRFLAEVKLARTVTHANVCRVYDVGEAEGRHFLSMEYIEGETLTSLLRRLGTLPEAKVIELGVQLCRGLAAVHQQGILHRDLKPSNLMIDPWGAIRITDFGLAIAADSFVAGQVRSGTPAYMSPEQHTGADLSVRSDLYALGLILYRMLTGKLPFAADTISELAQLHRTQPPVPPSAWGIEVDKVLERLILQCLEKQPADRPESAAEVGRFLAGRVANASGVALKALMLLAGPPTEEDSKPEPIESLRTFIGPLIDSYEGRSLGDDGERSYLLFDRPIHAVRCALACQRALDRPGRETPSRLRIGIHLSEVFSDLEADLQFTEAFREVASHARETAGHLLESALPGQILLTQGAFDLARQSAVEAADKVRWIAHGSYEIKGLAEAIGLFEVGQQGIAPLAPPRETARIRRQIIQETVAGWRPAPDLELPGRPHWLIEKKLSQGGFGEVWLARHLKTGERRVFKFCYDQVSLHSLQREITIFRLLKEALGDRDDIVRILDWNFDDAPYFIESEYTSGGDLLDWAKDQGGLSQVPLEARLDMVAQVARALAAAHSIGVLHKDVKPANILVTVDGNGRPRTRLSDFGIGRITEPSRLAEAGITVRGLTRLDTDPTQQQSLEGSQLYMAPELLEGKVATLQSDIYALGVVFYQMVVGDLNRALAPGWEREIEDDLLRQDIAAAIDGSSDRRLGDAQRLADDLLRLEERRHQHQAALAERREAKRMRLALQRSRRRRVLVLAVMVVLTIFSVMMTVQSRRIEAEAETARQALDFMQDLISGVDPRDPRHLKELTVREILDEGAQRIMADGIAADGIVADSLVAENLRDQPRIRARLLYMMGEAYQGINRNHDAIPLVEEALRLERDQLGSPPERWIDSLHLLAGAKLSVGDVDAADTLFREALEVRRKLEDPLGLARTLHSAGLLAKAQGRFEHAVDLQTQALKLRRESFKDDHPELADSLLAVADVQDLLGQFEAAEPLYREALEMNSRLFGEEHFIVGLTMRSLATMFHAQGDFAQAEELYRSNLEIQRQVFGEDDPMLAASMDSLAMLLMARGQMDEAERLVDEGLKLLATVHQDDHPEVARLRNHLARIYHRQERHDLAEETYRSALRSRLKTLGEDSIEVAVSYGDLARFYIDVERYEDARTTLEHSLQILGRRPASDPFLNKTRNLLGTCYIGLGRFEEAEALLLDSFEKLYPDAERQAKAPERHIRRLIKLYNSWNKPDEARRYQRMLEARGLT